MSQPTEYEHEITASRDEIAAILTGIVDGLRAGAVRLGDAEESVTVSPPEELTLDLELEVDDDDVELEVELEWSTTAAETEIPSAEEDTMHAVTSDTDSAETADSESVATDADAGESDTDGAEETISNDSDPVAEDLSGTETTNEAPGDVPTTAGDADDTESAGGVSSEVFSLAGAADESQSLAQFEVYRARDDKWRWRLRHRNGNIIATSGQGYTRKHNAVKGLRSVMTNSPDAPISQDAAASWPVE